MPVEIRELVIRAVVDGSHQKSPSAESETDRAEWLQTCVREVLRILQKTRER